VSARPVLAGSVVARPVAVAVAAALVLLTSACGGSANAGATLDDIGSGRASSTTTSTPAARATAPTATPSLTPHDLPAPASRTTTRPPSSSSRSSGAATCSVPGGVRAAQVVVVRSSGVSATIRACRRVGAHYVVSLGPYAGHVGLHGVSASKREGDLQTPAGVFPLRGGFGRFGNPGLDQSWLRVDSHDVWVDDSHSALYNTHQRTPANGRWTSAESLDVSAYDYAQVIGYNEARTPGRGSAIFLHVDHGGGTAGCVSVPSSNLVSILRWERPGAVIAIS
jgi:L,D-peptidoglycan transpeptidase YkuD (ErfK/YbiS/YcfS/YnhG family)